MLDDVDLSDAEPTLGAHSAPTLMYPQRHYLRAARNHPNLLKEEQEIRWRDEAAFFQVAPAQRRVGRLCVGSAERILQNAPLPRWRNRRPRHCNVVDIASGRIFKGVKSTKQRLTDIAAECQNIAALWPTI